MRVASRVTKNAAIAITIPTTRNPTTTSTHGTLRRPCGDEAGQMPMR